MRCYAWVPRVSKYFSYNVRKKKNITKMLIFVESIYPNETNLLSVRVSESSVWIVLGFLPRFQAILHLKNCYLIFKCNWISIVWICFEPKNQASSLRLKMTEFWEWFVINSTFNIFDKYKFENWVVIQIWWYAY